MFGSQPALNALNFFMADVRDGLDGPHLVVDEHHGHDDGLLVERGGKRVEVDDAGGCDAGPGSPEPLTCEPVGRGQDALVLEGRRDDAVPTPRGPGPGAPGGPGRALDRQVVGLGPAAGENDLCRRAAERGRDVLPRLLEGGLRAPGDGVPTRRIPERPGQERLHGGDGLGPHRRGGRVVEVGRRGVWSHPKSVRAPRGRVPLLCLAYRRGTRLAAPPDTGGAGARLGYVAEEGTTFGASDVERAWRAGWTTKEMSFGPGITVTPPRILMV